MAIDVQNKIKRRRMEKDSYAHTHTDHYEKSKRFLESIDDVIDWMSSTVIAMLAESVDDLNAGSHEFKTGMQRCLRRLLVVTSQKTESVVFFHEAIPGFTVLAIKKEGWGEDDKSATLPKKGRKLSKVSVDQELVEDVDAERQEVMQSIVSAYVQRTGNRVLSLEGSDIVIVMFPVSDLKRNLHDMGFWFE